MTYQDYSSLIRRVNTLWFVPVGAAAIYLALLPLLILLFRVRWRGLLLGYVTMFLLIRVWLILITTCWLVVLNFTLDEARMTKLLDEIMHSGKYVSLIWLDMFVVIAIFAVPYARNSLKARREASGAKPARYARVVVPPALLMLPLGSSMLLGAAMLLCDCPWNPTSCQMTPCLTMVRATRLILEYAGWILAAGGVVVQFTDGSFKVASDIVSYFKTDVAHTSVNPLTALALAYRYNPRKASSFGARLRRRFLAICKDVASKGNRVQGLRVVAHSLGTVIAIDALGQRDSALSGLDVTMVTMGSPYMNIFHYYFPHMFPALGRQALPTVSSVTNVYRENDYMGTRLSEGDGFVTERRQGPNGHFGYFEDPGVLSEVAGAILRSRY